MSAAMGRRKGSTEIIFDQKQVNELVQGMKALMPEAVKGAVGVAPEKTFNEFTTKGP